jgi:prepilin-type N-terminal cleavage/methylation domain-containing protein
MQSLPKQLKAFTLIELLTVIAVVAILAAILIPSISKVRESANVAKSISNLRQIGNLMNLYASEKNNRYPNTKNRDGDWWIDSLMEYAGFDDRAKVKELLVCPVAGKNVDFSDSNEAVTSYAVHEFLVGKEPSGEEGKLNPAYGVPRTAIARPSEQIMVATGAHTQSNGGTTVTFWEPWQGYQAMSLDQAIPVPPDPTQSFGHMSYHLKGSVGVVMVDGHAELIPLGEVKWRHYLPLVK